MEHEDNAHLDNVLQSSPHLMDNLQMASGDGVCDNVVAEEIGSSIGGKFGEHEGHDQEEWKYIKEGQQSEKQQERIKDGIDSKDMEDVEDVGNGHGYVYEVGDVGADDLLLLDKHEVGNGVVGISAAVDVDAINTPTGIEENEALNNYGDFSPTSNTTSIGGEDVDSDNGVLQVEMKIETATLLQSQPVENLLGAGGAERNFVEMEEEEPSSLATNTTNGTNSLSENAPLQQLSSEKNDLKTVELSIENKENANPSLPSIGLHGGKDEIIRPIDLDFETHSHLNPNALVFVPSVGSNPASPLVPTSDSAAFTVGEPALNSDAETAPQPHPNSIARHLLSDDDFVAQSPRKGSVESNLDGIALPEENDFEHEAAKRPHELEQEDDLIGVGTVQHLQQFENHNNDGVHLLKEDKNAEEADYSLDIRHSPANIIDHGPETSVDLDADIGIQLCDNDNLAQQHKFEMPDPIEDVLNTVQPLPIDTESVNVSFIEERSQQELEAGGKELLDVEEKDYISQSPSTEEMKMNMQNQMHSSIKDIPQIPIDMHDGANMQESFYLDSTSTELQNADDVTLKRTGENLTDASNPYLVADHISFENSCFAKPSGAELEIDFEHEHPSLNIFAPEFTPGQKSVCTDGVSPSPMSTEEKHLVEDTKELATKSETSDELEQKIDDLKLSTKDGILSQVETAPIAANIVESLNPFAAPESEQHKTVEELPIDADQSFSNESHLHADFLQQNEQFYHNEQQNDHQAKEIASESVYAGFEGNLFSTQQEDESSEYPAKQELEVKGFESPVAESISIASPPEPEPVSLSIETPLEPTSVAHLESAAAEVEAEPVTEPEHISQPESLIALEPEPKPDNALHVSNGISNVSTIDEALLVTTKDVVPTTPEAFLETAIDETKKDASETVVAAATIGAIATTAAVVTVAATAPKKIEVKKSRTPTSTKSKTVDIKKGADPTKKTTGAPTKTSASTVSSERPRTAPSKTATAPDKKVTATTAAAKPPTSTTTRKPLSSISATSRTVTKTTASTRPTTAPTAAKSSVSRTNATTITRRSAPTSTSNGTTAVAKPKAAGSAPTKPTTLGLSATAKPKLISPRTTLTSQLRKAAPASTGTGLTTARSPLKTTAPTTNGVTKSATNTTTASRAKSSTSTTITTTTTKTFTARPAPKTTHSSTISSTTTRRTVGVVSSSSTTGARTTSSMLQKKTPPGTGRPISATKSSLSPTKPSSATLKSKTKDVAKKPVTPIKSANELKAKATEEQPKLNGTPSKSGVEELGKQVEHQPHLNGEGDEPQKVFENGMHHEVLGNGEDSLLDQHAQASLLDA